MSGVRVGAWNRTATVSGMVCSTLNAFPEALTLRATFHSGPGVYALGLFLLLDLTTLRPRARGVVGSGRRTSRPLADLRLKTFRPHPMMYWMQYLRCQNCGYTFQSPFQLSASSFVLDGNFIPCPRCHKNVNTDGAYVTDFEGNVISYNGQPTRFASKVLNFLVGKRIDTEELEVLRQALSRVQEEGFNRAAVVSAIEGSSPTLSFLGKGAPNNSNDLRDFIIVLLLLINILISRGANASDVQGILSEFNSQIGQHTISTSQQSGKTGQITNVTINIVNNNYINEVKIDRYIVVLQKIISGGMTGKQAREVINKEEPELSPLAKYFPEPNDVVGDIVAGLILPLLLSYRQELTDLFRRRRREDGPLTKEELRRLRETVLSGINKE